MMVRAKFADNGTAPGRRVHFRCPGCDDVHGVVVDWDGGWGFNNNLERPTFTPSIRVGGVQSQPDSPFHKPNHPDVAPGKSIVCHSFVTDGQIQFLGDCTHALAGQTVDLPEWAP